MTDAVTTDIHPATRARRAPTGMMRIIGYVVSAIALGGLLLGLSQLGSSFAHHRSEGVTIALVSAGAFTLGVMLVIAGAIEQRLIEINHTLKNR